MEFITLSLFRLLELTAGIAHDIVRADHPAPTGAPAASTMPRGRKNPADYQGVGRSRSVVSVRDYAGAEYSK